MKNIKKFIIVSSIFVVLLALIISSLAFSRSIELFLNLKPNLYNIHNNAFEVHFIDVGQGDAIAIRFPNDKTMLIDSGPNYAQDNLHEYLERVFFADNYNTFDYVFLTHSDIDHSGNMQFIINNYTVKNFCRPLIYSYNLEPNKITTAPYDNNEVYDNIIKLLNDKNITTFFATTGARIDVGAGTIDMYHYPYLNNQTATNDCSTMLIINSNNSSACFSGDMGELYETQIASYYSIQQVDLFKLAHHGSKYSNSYDFINWIKPKFVACSVGENSFGHPTSEVLLRLAQYDENNNANTFNTLKTTLHNGNIIYYTNPNEQMAVTTISSLGDYLFVDWSVIVIIASVTLAGVYAIYVFTGKFKLSINVKNMKQ